MIRLLEEKDAAHVAQLLNDFLPFQPETAETVLQAKGVQIVCEIDDEIVGYIAGIPLHDSYEEMPYFQEKLKSLHELSTAYSTYYSTHLVVHPKTRGQGIGRQLVQAYMKEVQNVCKHLIVVGWVQSDTNRWDAEKLFVEAGIKPYAYIDRYFESYNVFCPNCKGNCYCDAHIHHMLF